MEQWNSGRNAAQLRWNVGRLFYKILIKIQKALIQALKARILTHHSCIPAFHHSCCERCELEQFICKPCPLPQLLFDPKQLVIFRDAITARHGTGFNLATIYTHG